MLKKVIILVIFFTLQQSMAGDTDVKSTSPLTKYAGGFSLGSIRSLNEELDDVSPAFFKVSFLNSIYFTKNVNLFIDIDWFCPLENFGVDFGANFIFSPTKFRPYIGIGAGVSYFNHKERDFGENIGLTIDPNIGFMLDVTEAFQIKVQIPYQVTFNKYIDHSIGLEIGFLFSSRFRKIEQLHYN